jgi:ketopantoate reductase
MSAMRKCGREAMKIGIVGSGTVGSVAGYALVLLGETSFLR